MGIGVESSLALVIEYAGSAVTRTSTEGFRLRLCSDVFVRVDYVPVQFFLARSCIVP